MANINVKNFNGFRFSGMTGYDPGPIDGIMGTKTHAALRAFQLKMRLPVTREPDEETLKRLGIH